MIVKEVKYNDKDLRYKSYHETCNNSNFIILDDKTFNKTNDFDEVIKCIEMYGYKVDIIDIADTSKVILDNLKNRKIKFDCLLTVGMGGLQSYKQIENDILNCEVCNIKWNRLWDNDVSLGFDTDIDKYQLNGKKIVILEDVIASGNTLWTLYREIQKMGGVVVMINSSLIQESSPIISTSFCNTFSVVMINKPSDSRIDPFWYPPIYSLRHLMFGDDEMNKFYEVLNNKYFNDEDRVERLIKKIRRR